jgi:hypothetical protein
VGGGEVKNVYEEIDAVIYLQIELNRAVKELDEERRLREEARRLAEEWRDNAKISESICSGLGPDSDYVLPWEDKSG